MNGADKFVSRSVLRFIAPVALMLAGWWGTFLAGAGLLAVQYGATILTARWFTNARACSHKNRRYRNSDTAQ